MLSKEIICPGRLRHLPAGFGWIDHRLVRENMIVNYSCEALSLYLFLVTVADEDGVSWYSESAIVKRLALSSEMLKLARQELSAGQLIAYRNPYYQVLEVPQERKAHVVCRTLSEALGAADNEGEICRRQPSGTEGLGVSLYPREGIYRRPEDECDALSLKTILAAMGGGLQ